MSSGDFDFDELKLIAEIRKRKSRRVFVQLPEGLKTHSSRLARVIEKNGATAIISADPCYGACDVGSMEAKSLGADLIVHYGHNDMGVSTAIPTIYIEVKAKFEVEGVVKEAVKLLTNWSKVGLVTTVQHTHIIEEVE